MFLGCDEFALTELLEHDEFVAIIAIALGCMTAIIGILASTISGVAKTRAKEATKRELAAYVAEGTLKPDDAVAMINAGRPKWEQS